MFLKQPVSKPWVVASETAKQHLTQVFLQYSISLGTTQRKGLHASPRTTNVFPFFCVKQQSLGNKSVGDSL